MSVADVEGIDWVRLVEVQLLLPGSHWELVTRTSDDLFALFESQGKPFPAGGRMIRAAFRVKFTDSKTPRSVVIKPPNVAQFTRDDDGGLVEAWLLARGLIVRPGTHDVEHRDSVLEGA